MGERRLDFLAHHDWIRKALMFEPRGHDVMSGSMLYPPTRADCDVGILFIEVSGCLPMCGHGTIGTVTMAVENGLVAPAKPGELAIDAPAGRVVARYVQDGRSIDSVRITNVASYLAASAVAIDLPGVGELVFDIAWRRQLTASSRRRKFRRLEEMSAATCCACRRSCAGCSTRRSSRSIRKTRRSAASATSCGPVSRRQARPCATPCSMATMRSIARRAAPAPRRAWPSSPPQGRCGWRRIRAAREHHRLPVRWPGRRQSAVGNHDAIVPSIDGLGAPAWHQTIFVDDRDPLRARLPGGVGRYLRLPPSATGGNDDPTPPLSPSPPVRTPPREKIASISAVP